MGERINWSKVYERKFDKCLTYLDLALEHLISPRRNPVETDS